MHRAKIFFNDFFIFYEILNGKKEKRE